ncbi:MAG TPA: DUF559 domain-containing protein [Marmoricola sp.]|nr:DUF559 domain-containing protein [Marmoricola sp.]
MDAVAAVALGGVLTATSGAPHHTLWTLADDKLHVQVARHASRFPIDRAAAISGKKVCIHWAKARISRETPVADPLQIVIDADHCQPRLNSVAIADSALNQGLIGFDELEVALPALAAWCDPASQSGTESMARVCLRRRGIKARTQVQIDRVGSVDLVVGERLVIECDSAKHHDGYQSERDYDRDQELMRQGYLVLRLKYRHVVYEWDRIEQLVLGIVRARRHLWRVGTEVKGTFLAL